MTPFPARVPAFHRPDWSPCPDTLPRAPKKPAAAYAKAVPHLPVEPFPTVFCPSSKSPPVPLGQRAKARGTTSDSPPLCRARPREVPDRTPALYRARPAEPTHGLHRFGPLLRDVFTPPPSPPSTIRGFSWQDCAALLVLIIALTGGSIAGKAGFVKRYSVRKARKRPLPRRRARRGRVVNRRIFHSVLSNPGMA